MKKILMGIMLFLFMVSANAIEIGVSESGIDIKDTPSKTPINFTGRIIWGEDWQDHTAGEPAKFIPVRVVGIDEAGKDVGWKVTGNTNDNGEFNISMRPGVRFRFEASAGDFWSKYETPVISGKYSANKFDNCKETQGVLDCTQPRYEDFSLWEKYDSLPTVTFDENNQAHMQATDKHYTYIQKPVNLTVGTTYNLEVTISSDTAADAKAVFTTDNNNHVRYFYGPGIHKFSFKADVEDKHLRLFAYDKKVIYKHITTPE